MPFCPTIREIAPQFACYRTQREGPHATSPRVRPNGTALMRGGVPGGALPRLTPVTFSQLKCPCGIFTSDLVFENVRQRVGCVSVCSPSEMSIAVEHGRFLLTATR